jgi:hypothetical protein
MRKDSWTYWTTGLPNDSEALADLQRLAEELGVTRAEANRLLLIAYSKASRGEWSQLWGFSAGSMAMIPHLVGAQNGRADTKSIELQQRRKRSAAAAAAVALDLEDEVRHP